MLFFNLFIYVGVLGNDFSLVLTTRFISALYLSIVEEIIARNPLKAG